jgi:hypothetical protein
MIFSLRLQCVGPFALTIAISTGAWLCPVESLAGAPCSGHALLPKPRTEASCSKIVPQTYVSSDKEMRALVFPTDISLDTTPDMESRVVVRSSSGVTVTSLDHSSPRGMNGYHVYRAKWSPDSQFFVYSLTSSGGHSPWSFPIMVFGRKSSQIVKFSEMIGGKPTLSGDFSFSGPHTLTATTWKQPASAGDKDLEKVPVTVDLEEAFDTLVPAQ